MIRSSDAGVALATAVAAFAVYVVTLAPGLIAIGDTPKFQFIGRILGIAHAPGYPLYVLVSHLFGYLPFGSLAYRINLMSAVFGAAACGTIFLCARGIGVRPLIAAGCALGLAFGTTFWTVSTIAEVYTLNAFLVAVIIVTLLAWHRTERVATFYTVVALVGIAAGNHTTVIFMVPAVALFASLVAPRFALRPRTIATAALITLVCLTQYLFVLVRTRQGAWGDVYAGTLPDLVRVAMGTEYMTNLVPGGSHELLTARVPAMVRAFVREIGLPALVLAVAGLVALGRRPVLGLLIVALIGYTGFAMTHMPPQFEVFLVPAFMACWLLAAAGAERVASALGNHTVRSLGNIAAVVFLIIPFWEGVSNYAERDLSHTREDMRFFDGLFSQLPDGAVLLHDDFLIDRMMYYKTLGERADEQRHVTVLPGELEIVKRAARDGHGVFAFPRTARTLRLLEGADFGYTPLAISHRSLAAYLDDLPADTMVAVGVPGIHVSSFAEGGRLPLAAIGFDRILRGAEVDGIAVIGVRRSAMFNRNAFPVSGPGSASASYRGSMVTAPVAVRADGTTAAIEFGGREIIRSGAGMAVAVWGRDGMSAAFVVSAETHLVPTLPTPYAVYQLRGFSEPQPIEPTAVDLTATATHGNFVYTSAPGHSRLVLYGGRDEKPLAPALLESSARDWPAFEVQAFTGPHRSDGELARALERDGFASHEVLARRHVYRIVIDTNWEFSAGVRVGLGGKPDIIVGRLVAGSRNAIHAFDLFSHLRRVDERTFSLHMARDYQEQLIGPGWSSVQYDGIAPYRETVDREAELLLPIANAVPHRIGVQLLRLPGADTPQASIVLRANQQPLPPIVPTPQWTRYWWDIPKGILETGINSVVIQCSPGVRIAVSDVLIETAH